MRYCSRCGAQINDNSKFCPNCGAETEYSLRQKNTVPTNSNAKVFGILSLIFGAMGGILGLIFGIICIKKDRTGRYKVMGILGIVFTGIWLFILGMIIAFAY